MLCSSELAAVYFEEVKDGRVKKSSLNRARIE